MVFRPFVAHLVGHFVDLVNLSPILVGGDFQIDKVSDNVKRQSGKFLVSISIAVHRRPANNLAS